MDDARRLFSSLFPIPPQFLSLFLLYLPPYRLFLSTRQPLCLSGQANPYRVTTQPSDVFARHPHNSS